ncbi:hypothetical protein M408DRAFT_29534 [Serendipita vermifera MAFF 305830]|uniref:PNPLA domain-containing protein n=1 Tax=Serendipita vermifera MAFF 305830 TaxID=933852 RepID=A0A0C3A9Y5_SERVB|nr:hypothetical protein M408DRAFT_29534 [Serendipita vermifera MAFF 305830]
MKPRLNLRLASFDGGGARGLSQLEIMSNIMHRLNWGRGPNDSEAMLPYQHFDLIGGSGTGGLIAIMLAKLRMSADEAAEEFCAIIENVLGPVNMTPKERLEKLRTLLEDMMKRKDLPLNMKLVDEGQNDSCACFVVASLQNNVASKVCLRSYPVRSHQALPITVIEAALASCAKVSLFDPVTVGMGRKRKEYIAAGLGATNPIREVITEARSLFGGESTVACLLSVGTGHPGIITLTSSHEGVDLNRAMREMMNDCTQKAREMEDQIGQSGIYFRFSVEQGMQNHVADAMDTAWIVTQTETYMEEQHKKLEVFSKTSDRLSRDISLNQLESGDIIIGADKMSVDGNTGRLEEIGKIYQNNVVARLKPSNIEFGCPVEECMEGTREDILGTVFDWVADSGAANIFWLKGHPGVGKSAIAVSLVEKLRETARLGSSFFFQRAKSSAMTTDALWRTVAYELARRYPTVRKHLMEALEADETLPNTINIEKLFRKLIHEPFMACEERDGLNMVVVIIDALDECGGLDGQHSNQRSNLMRTLKTWSTLPKTFKLIVTSRAEPDIVHLFSTIQHASFEILSGKLAHSRSSKDIERFLEYHLSQIAARSDEALAPDWPGRQIKGRLTRSASGLFIWVDTVVRFLRRGEPQEQLDLILGGASMGGLSALYSSILQASFVEPSEKVLESFRRIVGAIILAKEPLSASSLIHLCSVDHSTLSYIRGGLQSVMDSGEALRFSHQSFVDFLIDSTECRSRFSVNVQRQNRHMTLGCFQVMRQHLKFNICDIKSSYKRNREIMGLEQQLKERILPHLTYASYYWADHLAEATFDPEISEHIEYFTQTQFLFWLEVLSLTKRVNLGTKMIVQLIEWLRTGNQDDKLAKDMKQFVAAFGSLISQSVPHIYLSALPFAPRVTESVIAGHRSPIDSVVFSPDGTRIVSGSFDKIVRVWDAETAEMVAGPFEGHTGQISSVKFSPDGRRIASGAWDRTIRVWDAKTAEMIARPFEGHTGRVSSVTFSPDGTRIVSGSWDKTIRVWDAETADMVVEPLEGHTQEILCVAFSPDGRRIASVSRDRTIQVWDGKTARIIAGPFEGHTGGAISVAFLPDGACLVSGSSSDFNIYLWNAETADMVAGPFEGHTKEILCVAFSPDGGRIASGSWDRTIRVWDAKTAEMIAGPFEGHIEGVSSVAFSPDGARIVSGSYDGTIRIWDAETAGMVTEPFDGHTGGVFSVALSPDGTRIVSGSSDKTVRVWDAEIGEMVTGPLKGHTDWVTSVVFSPDGTRIVSGSHGETTHVFDPENMILKSTEERRFAITSVAFSPDGRHVVSCTKNNMMSQVWNTETGEMNPEPFEILTTWANSVVFSSDKRRIVFAPKDSTIRLWDAEMAEMVVEPFEGHTKEILCVAFSPDGGRIASGSWDRTIRVWDGKTAKIIAGPFEGHTGGVVSVAISPDGRRVASGSHDMTVRVWDAETIKMIAGPFEGHTGSVNCVAFSSDGTCILSGSDDGMIRLWNVKNAEVNSPPTERNAEGINPMASSLNELPIASSSEDRSDHWWGTTASLASISTWIISC